jgi:hypothetical protein
VNGATRGFHVGLVLLLGGMVVAGFWPYYADVVRGRFESHWLIHLNAAVLSGWMVLLFTQVLLVYLLWVLPASQGAQVPWMNRPVDHETL